MLLPLHRLQVGVIFREIAARARGREPRAKFVSYLSVSTCNGHYSTGEARVSGASGVGTIPAAPSIYHPGKSKGLLFKFKPELPSPCPFSLSLSAIRFEYAHFCPRIHSLRKVSARRPAPVRFVQQRVARIARQIFPEVIQSVF